MAITKEYIVLNEVEVDFIASAPSPVVICPQFEDRGRAIRVSLKNNREDFPVPEGYTPHVYELKYDKKVVDNVCEYDGNTVMVEVTKQMSFTPGDNLLRVALINDETGAVAQSIYIVLKVTKGPNVDDAEQSSDEFEALVVYANQAKASADKAAKSEANAESSKTAAQAALQGTLDAEGRVQAIVASNEAYTKQQSHDLFAAALATKTGPAASLEVYPDWLSNLRVYANGFTTQEGVGDPSPINVRKLTNGGLKLVEIVIDGSQSFQASPSTNSVYCTIPIKAANSSPDALGVLYCDKYEPVANNDLSGKKYGIGLYYFTEYDFTRVAIKDPNVLQDTAKAKTYFAENPARVWYLPANEDQSTGLYTPIPIVGGEFVATCLKLTKELCEGDSVVNWIMSGCDKMITFDGSEDEGWIGSQLQGVMRLRKEIPDMLAYNASGHVLLSDWLINKADNAGAFQHMYSDSGGLYIFVIAESLEEALQVLAKNPLTIWYRSTNYTETADIPVSLETHQRTVLVLDGTTQNRKFASMGDKTGSGYYAFRIDSTDFKRYGLVLCNIASNNGAIWNVDKPNICGYVGSNGETIAIRLDIASLEEANELLATKYAEGTPVTIVYELATLITYAHPVVRLPAYPDGDGKVTITGQSDGTVTVEFNKSVAKAFEEIVQRVSALELNALRG